MRDDLDQTMYFNKDGEDDLSPQEILRSVYRSLDEKGYNPINQIVGYLISGDPAYITSYHNARTLIKQYSRDEYIEIMLKHYLGFYSDHA